MENPFLESTRSHEQPLLTYSLEHHLDLQRENQRLIFSAKSLNLWTANTKGYCKINIS
jgi:hypothetical protein